MDAIEQGVKEFNKYRAPEAVAKIISKSNKSFVIEFTGHYCRTCGFYDYFDDFIIELKLKAKISKIEEFDGGANVTFEIESDEKKENHFNMVSQ